MKIAHFPVPLSDPALRLLAQLGVEEIVAGRPEGDTGPIWDFMALLRMRQRVESAGLKLTVIESFPITDRVKLGLPGRDEDLDQFCESLANMGRAGIPIACYNWMAGFGWLRTSLADRGRGGALVTSYKHELMQNAPLTEYGETTQEQLWDAFEYFLKRVIPVAEQHNVKLALHPDDPPLSPIRGMARIMISFEAFKRVIDLVPSPSNGITLCQGNFAAMTDVRDMTDVIRYFGQRDRNYFVHFRDVSGKVPSYTEVFHDEGPTDMLACMKAYQEVGFKGPMRPDHSPTLEGESNEHPGYMVLGNIFAIGYMRGLIEAAQKGA